MSSYGYSNSEDEPFDQFDDDEQEFVYSDVDNDIQDEEETEQEQMETFAAITSNVEVLQNHVNDAISEISEFNDPHLNGEIGLLNSLLELIAQYLDEHCDDGNLSEILSTANSIPADSHMSTETYENISSDIEVLQELQEELQ